MGQVAVAGCDGQISDEAVNSWGCRRHLLCGDPGCSAGTSKRSFARRVAFSRGGIVVT